MISLLKRYKWEVIVAVASVVLCLVFLLPQLGSGGNGGRYWEIGLLGEANVYQNGTGVVQLTGKTVRDAVETRLGRIREIDTRLDGEKVNSIRINQIGFVLRLRRFTEVFEDIDLQGARLTGLDFRGVSLIRANFSGADLSETRLEGAHLGGARFDQADLSRAHIGPRPTDLPKFNWIEVDEESVDYVRRDIELMDIYTSPFMDASFKGAKLVGATLRLSTSEGIDLRGADLKDASIEFTRPESVDTKRTFKDVLYDDATKVQGLRLAGSIDLDSAFVQWAQARGAVVENFDPAPASKSDAP